MQQHYIDSNNQVQTQEVPTPRSKHEFSLDDPKCVIPSSCPTLAEMTPEQLRYLHRKVDNDLREEFYALWSNPDYSWDELREENDRMLHDPVYLENCAALLQGTYGGAAFDDE